MFFLRQNRQTNDTSGLRNHLQAYTAPTLGFTYRDRITGYSGIAIGHCAYLTGCSQTLLIPKIGADGKRQDGEWFDDQRLEQLEAPRISLNNGATPGCDRAAPKR